MKAQDSRSGEEKAIQVMGDPSKNVPKLCTLVNFAALPNKNEATNTFRIVKEAKPLLQDEAVLLLREMANTIRSSRAKMKAKYPTLLG